jgi:metal-responsive CopG/Arc/MetJ family transcriptional regulator
MSNEKSRMLLELDPEMAKELEKRASEEYRTKTGVIRLALRRYFDSVAQDHASPEQ